MPIQKIVRNELSLFPLGIEAYFSQISLVVKSLYSIRVVLNLKPPNLEGKSPTSLGNIEEREKETETHREIDWLIDSTWNYKRKKELTLK